MWLEYEVKSVGNSDTLITLTKKERVFFLFGKEVKTVRQYRGSGTVWRHYPSANRCDSSIERLLGTIWTKYQWKEKPKAYRGDIQIMGLLLHKIYHYRNE